MLAHAPVGETLARRTAIVKMLHNVLDGTAKVLLLIGNMSVSSHIKGYAPGFRTQGAALLNESLLGSVRSENINSICVSHSDGHRRRVD
jgi:hypothetical protein